MDVFRLCVFVIFIFIEENAVTSSPILITLERAQMLCDNVSATNCSVNIRRHNRTSPYLMDLYIHISKPIGRNLSVVFRSFEWKNNQYKESFIGFNKNLCDFLEADAWLQAMIMDFGNIPSSCPVAIGLYYLKDFRTVESSFPVGFPLSKWKFSYEFTYTITHEPILRFSIAFKVDRLTIRKKKKVKIIN